MAICALVIFELISVSARNILLVWLFQHVWRIDVSGVFGKFHVQTHARTDIRTCTFVLLRSFTCAHAHIQSDFCTNRCPIQNPRRLARSEMLVGSSFKTNLCLAPGLCVFDLFVLAGRVFLSSGLHVVVGRGRFGSGERRPCSFWVWILKQKSWTVELWWIMFLTSYDLRSLQSQLL